LTLAFKESIYSAALVFFNIVLRRSHMNKRRALSWLPLLVLLLACVPVYAQRPTCNQRQEDIDAVRGMPDIGADIAIVVTKATLYESASETSRALLTVERGNPLSLVSRDPVRSMYRVIDVDSAKEGWIGECAVILKLSNNRQSGPPMEEERTGTDADPQLVVSNLEKGTDLNLRINGTLYVIPANTSKTLNLKPGKYEYYAYSPGIRPAFGNDNFTKGMKYSWTFQIVQR
jgi:hypothetical protein